jgi:hypothetical protein
VGADIVIAGLLQPDRCARLVDFHERAPSLPSLEEVLGATIDHVFPTEVESEARLASARQAAQRALVQRMIHAAASDRTPARVRWRVEAALADLGPRLEQRSRLADRLPSQAVQERALAREIERFLTRQTQPSGLPPQAPDAPPGSPIGSSPAWDWSWGGCSRGG